MKAIKTLILTALLFGGIMSAQAQLMGGSQKIVYVDSEYIMENIPEYGDAQEEGTEEAAAPSEGSEEAVSPDSEADSEDIPDDTPQDIQGEAETPSEESPQSDEEGGKEDGKAARPEGETSSWIFSARPWKKISCASC